MSDLFLEFLDGLAKEHAELVCSKEQSHRKTAMQMCTQLALDRFKKLMWEPTPDVMFAAGARYMSHLFRHIQDYDLNKMLEEFRSNTGKDAVHR
jgi:hypothetical protein